MTSAACCSPLLLSTMVMSAESAANKWEGDPSPSFEAADAKSFPAPGGNVFIGSSSIVKWTTIVQDLAPHPSSNAASADRC
jgi:hypothetical protein